MTKDAIDIEKREGFVYCIYKGPMTSEHVAKQLRKISEETNEWGFYKFLYDLREAETKAMHAFDDYELAYHKAEIYGFKRGSKHAALVSTNDFHRWEFMETVSINAGYLMRVFTDENQALEWIQE